MSGGTRREAGYSLVEVMAAVVLLTAAIVPMVGMFDAALRSVRASGDYDRARALAHMKLEALQSLPYDRAAREYAGSPWKPYAGPGGEEFEYRVEKRPLLRPPTDSEQDPAAPVEDFKVAEDDTGLMRIAVVVRWGDGNTYGASGVIVR